MADQKHRLGAVQIFFPQFAVRYYLYHLAQNDTYYSSVSFLFFVRYPNSVAQDDIRVLVLMIKMSMWKATLHVATTIGLILDAHNVLSHVAVFLDCFKDTQS